MVLHSELRKPLLLLTQIYTPLNCIFEVNFTFQSHVRVTAKLSHVRVTGRHEISHTLLAPGRTALLRATPLTRVLYLSQLMNLLFDTSLLPKFHSSHIHPLLQCHKEYFHCPKNPLCFVYSSFPPPNSKKPQIFFSFTISFDFFL